MAQDLSSQLTMTADASGIEAGVGRGKRSFADLGISAQNAGKQASAALDTIGKGADGASKKVQTATSNLVSSIQRQIATVEAGSKSGSKFFETLAQQRGVPVDVLRPYLDQLDQVIAKQKQAGDGFKALGVRSNAAIVGDAQGIRASLNQVRATGSTEEVARARAAATAQIAALRAEFDRVTPAIGAAEAKLASTGMTARATAAALRQVPAQFTDIVTSLAAGQAPLTVLLQQGGQLKDVFGGIGPAARALGGYIVGLINPFTIAAAAAAALAVAYKLGSAEADEFAKAIILSGNASGTTVGQLQAMSAAISKVAGTQGNAAEALAQFAATGDVASTNLQKVAQAAILFERATGQAVSKTVEQFSSLAKDPLQASLKLNESTRFLTASLYAQIKALDEQGRSVDAANLAQKAYADTIESRSGQITARLGFIERAWIAIKDATKGAADAALNIGRTPETNTQLQEAQARLANLRRLAETQSQNVNGGSNTSGLQAQIAAEQERIRLLSQRVFKEGEIASSAKTTADQLQASIEFDKQGVRFASDKLKLEKDIAQARQTGAAAGKSQAEIDKRIAEIQADFAKKQPKGPKPVLVDKNELQGQLAAAKNLLDQQVSNFRNADSILEALRSAGLSSEKDYYASKRLLIEQATEAESRALENQVGALQAANAAIERLRGRAREEREPARIDNERKIADAEAQILRLREATSARLVTLSIQEEAAAKRLAAAFLTARQAAQDAFDVMQRQQARDLESFGQGQQQRGRNQGVSQIEDRFSDQRRELENQRALLEAQGQFTEESRKQYDERLRIIQEFQGKSIASFEAYYDKLQARERDANLGALEALRNYADEAAKVGKGIENAVGKAFSGLEDALVKFADTGKLSLKSLAQSIQSDINRIAIRQVITGPLAGAAERAGLGGVLGRAFGQTPASPANAAALTAQTAQTSAVNQSKVALDSLAQAAGAAAQALGNRPSSGLAIDTSGAGTTATQDPLRVLEARTESASTELGQFSSSLVNCFPQIDQTAVLLGGLGQSTSLASIALQALPAILRALGGSSGGGSIGGVLGGVFGRTTGSTPSAERDVLRRMEGSAIESIAAQPSGERDELRRMEASDFESISISAQQAADGLGGVGDASDSVSKGLPGLLDSFGGSLGDLLGNLGSSIGDLVSGVFGSSGGGGTDWLSLIGGFFAEGGRPPVGVPSVVGERGRELFIPDTAKAMLSDSGPVMLGERGPQIIVPAGPGTILSNEQTTRLVERIERERRIETAAATAPSIAERVAPLNVVQPIQLAAAQPAITLTPTIAVGRTDAQPQDRVSTANRAQPAIEPRGQIRLAAATPEKALAPRLIVSPGDIAVHVQGGHSPVLAPQPHPQIVLAPHVIDRTFPVTVNSKSPQINLSAPTVSRETRERFEHFDRWRESLSKVETGVAPRVNVHIDPAVRSSAATHLIERTQLSAPELSPDLTAVLDKLRRLKFFAEGGRPPIGRASVVGELGPELFIPDTPGTIVPASESARLMSSAGDVKQVNNNHWTINIPSARQRETAMQVASKAGMQVARSARRNG